MVNRTTEHWLRAIILAAAMGCASAFPAQESTKRTLPSRHIISKTHSKEHHPNDETRVAPKPHHPETPAPHGSPTGPQPGPKPLPTDESPAADAAGPNNPPQSPTPPPAAAPAPDNNAPASSPRPAATAQEESILPNAPPLERFKPLWQNSPFARNILPENKPVVATAEFTLLGIGGLGNKWCALVLDKKSQPQRRLLLFDDATEGQDRLVKVTESPSLDQVTAEIVVGGAPYVVRYDIASLKAQAATAGPGPQHVPAPAIKPAPGQPPPPQPSASPPSPVRVLPRRRYYPSSNPQR